MKKNDSENQLINNLSIVSHELKTPVYLIYNTAKIADMKLDSDDISKEFLKEYLQNIITNCNKINLMINNIMTINSNEKAEYVYINLKNFIDTFTKALSPMEIEYNFKITVLFETKTDSICIPVNTIERILLNLITNSIKYNSKKDIKITLKISDKNSMVNFTVKDNGDGISEENIPKVTEKFFRASKTTSTGLGLGLSLVKEMVQNMGGQLEIKSKIKKGTEVSFTVPINNNKPTICRETDYVYTPSTTYYETEFSALQKSKN